MDPVVKSARALSPWSRIRQPATSSVFWCQPPAAQYSSGPSTGLTLAKRQKAEVTLLTISRKGMEDTGRRILDRTLQQVKTRYPVRQQVVVADHVVKGILKEAKDYDIVILGASHEGIFQQILFGMFRNKSPRGAARPSLW